MPEYRGKECSDLELASEEVWLQKQGYRLTGKNTDKDLLPMEYMKSSHHGSAQSFEGSKKWLLKWRIR